MALLTNPPPLKLSMFSSPPPSLQTLSPSNAHLCLQTERFLRSLLGRDVREASFLVALSGGTDSLALLCMLHALRHRLKIHIGAAYVNHNLRPEAAQEQEYCEAVCTWLGCEFFTTTLDIPQLARDAGTGIEETARNARYTFFAKLERIYPYTFLATGHQLDDLAEDVLMRLVRGTGWPGLAGMTAWVPERKLVRPLLLTPRSALVAFLQGWPLTPVEDASNQSDAYTRNRVRHTILPLLLQENPSFLETVASLWKLGRIDEAFFSAELALSLEKPLPANTSENDLNEPEQKGLPSPTLESVHLSTLPAALRLRLYKRTLALLGPGQALSTTLMLLDEAWQKKRTGAVFQFPGNKTATVFRGYIRFTVSSPES